MLRVTRGGPTRAWAAARTTSSRPLSSRAPEVNTRGFGRMSTAPAASARIASIVPGSANPEQTTTGIGSVAMICLRKVMPSMRGISRSRRITCGRCRRILAMATRGSEAVLARMPAAARAGCS